MASGRFGINGTSINKMLDGMCVKTIVLIRPNLCGERHRQQRGDARQNIGKEKDAAKHARLHAEFDMEPVGDHALHDQAACEGIQRKERAEFEDNLLRTMQAEQCVFVFGGVRHFDGGETNRNKNRQHRPPRP